MADAETRKQRAAALEEKRRKLEEMKKRRTNRREDASSRIANLDEDIDKLLSQPAPLAAIPAQDVEALVKETAPVVVPDDAKSTSSNASNVIAVLAPAPPPKVIETFTVSTQTEEEDFPEVPEPDVEDEEDKERPAPDHQHENGTANAVAVEVEKEPKLLSETELEKEISSIPFSSFINAASKKVERLLGAPLLGDLLVDYVGETGSDRERDDKDESRLVSSRQVYACAKWTAGRDITGIDWSPLHRELVLSTYGMPSGSKQKGSGAVAAVVPHDTPSSSLTPRSGELQSDGLALVWSLTMPSRPEHILTCGSPVTAGRFHPSESTLILGGCESGQLVVWDVRAGRLPVQKSSLTGAVANKGHVFPIAGIDIIDGGLVMVSASTDGRLNFWSLANLRDPVESLQVSDSLASYAVAPESETLLVGDDYGKLFSIQVSGGRSSRRQVRKLESTDAEGHFGMVTSLSAQVLKKGAASRSIGLSKGFLRGTGGLVLSSGVDWTVQLWAPAYRDTPVLNMVSHSYDSFSDVQWCPHHPSLFATASSNGSVGIWNLATSLEEPISGKGGLLVESDPDSARGLSKLQWSHDGRRLAVASGDSLHILSMVEDVVRPKGDEDSKVMNSLVARGLITRQ